MDVSGQGVTQNVLGPETDGVTIDISDTILNYFLRKCKSNILLNFSEAHCLRPQVNQLARATKIAECGN